ncbi:ferredoxin [archaeon CG_4_10_14_0_2_um_filter_Archaea_38_6]|nr:MAG: ferredoxin [archaeon CG07_land_8_20_14_0_80_38_8]PIU88542.1 MAG: ferredoxin [archaeon CG06_land_8_20_14_3_00_37_11]PIX44140.1 MAG: ferredoxin [archaeon CG_4_8_14_3_um_filter_38_5]PJA22658.1 MAG: ferredoxin [archaeon CG_4_10_14_0_2_um_filter_Archaea_38_6]
MVKVSIKRSGCISCGNCWSVCPKVFEQNKEDTHSQIRKDYRIKNAADKGEVPESIKCVKTAEEQCPVHVISVK